jgi:predicted nuclease of predicted toxin-antitoxin system
MRWIVDAQLPPALAKLLSNCGHQAEHVEDAGLRNSSDTAIWDYALKHGAVIATKDEDFPSRALVARQTPVIVWLRIGNSSRKALISWFQPLLPDIEKRINAGETLIEIR